MFATIADIQVAAMRIEKLSYLQYEANSLRTSNFSRNLKGEFVREKCKHFSPGVYWMICDVGINWLWIFTTISGDQIYDKELNFFTKLFT